MNSESEAAVVQIWLPRALLRLFPKASPKLDVRAGTVGEAIDALDQRWPGMADRLRDSRPAIRRHINVFVAGRRATLETRLAPGADVTVLTAISGG